MQGTIKARPPPFSLWRHELSSARQKVKEDEDRADELARLEYELEKREKSVWELVAGTAMGPLMEC